MACEIHTVRGCNSVTFALSFKYQQRGFVAISLIDDNRFTGFDRVTAWGNVTAHTDRRIRMGSSTEREDRSMWAIGGGVLISVGTGFFFLKESPLAFVGCVLLGIGLGLMVTAILSRIGRRQTDTG